MDFGIFPINDNIFNSNNKKMKIIKFPSNKKDLPENEIVIIDSTKELPIRRYQTFQKLLMISNEVGSSFEDYDIRTSKLRQLIHKGMLEDALIELENRRQMVYSSFQEYSPKGQALALMVIKVNNEPVTDYTPSGCERTIDKLSELGFTESMLVDELIEVKKKSNLN